MRGVRDPGPLGLAAFALTTFVLSIFNADLMGKGGEPVVFASVPAADAGHAVGLYLIGWGIFTAYMLVASLRTTMAVATVFALLTVTFLLLGIGNAGAHPDVIKIGGWFGIVTAAAAWYASFAAVTNSTFGRTVLPVRPLGKRSA